MANTYPYIDLGTWEAYGVQPETYLKGPQQICRTQKSNEAAHGGTYSGKGTFLAFPAAQPFNAPNYRFHLTDFFSGSSMVRPSYLNLGPNKKYKFSAWVMTPSSNPIGSADVPIAIAPFITNHALPSSAPNGTKRAAVALANRPVNPTYVQTTVGACTDTWVKISYEFTTRVLGNYASSEVAPDDQVCVFCADSGMIGAVLMNIVHDAIVPAGTMNINGVLYIDDIGVEEVLVCDLALGTPSYTKTDETAVDANDGTITINATSQHAIQYSLDNVTFQNSNVFPGKAPGTYNVYVKDLGGCTAPVITNIVILEFTEGPPPPDPPEVPAGTLQINMKPVNMNNFVSWFATAGKINFASVSCSNANWDLPKAYRLNKFHKRHMPVVINDEQFSFYINFSSNFNYPNFSSLRLDLVNNWGVVQQGVGTLERVFQHGSLVNYYIHASVILSGVLPGVYRLAITDTSTDAPHDVILITQEIEVMYAELAPAYTARFRFRCSIDMYKFLYTLLPDFFQEIRLRVNVLEEDTDGSIDQYRSVSSGMLRNYAYDLDMFFKFETYYFNDLAHRAMFVFQAHDQIILNDKTYLIKSFYKVSWSPEKNTHKGTIELYEQEFSAANRYGNPSSFVVEDPVLGGDNGDVIGV